MRKFLFLIILAQALLLVVLLPRALAANSNNSTPKHPNCLQITVKFNAPAAWLKSSNNRSIMIGCAGSNKITGPQSCEGGVQTLKPEQTKTLGDCDCFHTAGCLVVGKVLKVSPNKTTHRNNITIVKTLDSTLGGKCSVVYVNRKSQHKIKLASICGTNEKRFDIGLNIKCTTPTPSTVPSITVTPTPGECVAPKPVTNVKVTCPSCFGPTQGPTPTPLPTEEPTPTTAPTCTPRPSCLDDVPACDIAVQNMCPPSPTPVGGSQ